MYAAVRTILGGRSNAASFGFRQPMVRRRADGATRVSSTVWPALQRTLRCSGIPGERGGEGDSCGTAAPAVISGATVPVRWGLCHKVLEITLTPAPRPLPGYR